MIHLKAILNLDKDIGISRRTREVEEEEEDRRDSRLNLNILKMKPEFGGNLTKETFKENTKAEDRLNGNGTSTPVVAVAGQLSLTFDDEDIWCK